MKKTNNAKWKLENNEKQKIIEYRKLNEGWLTDNKK